MPVRRFSILLSRVIADAVTMLIQGGIVLVVAVVMGAGVATGLLGAVGMLFLAALLGVVWACVTNLIALTTKSSELSSMPLSMSAMVARPDCRAVKSTAS
jgi:ABC-2 type transport system permease protein